MNIPIHHARELDTRGIPMPKTNAIRCIALLFAACVINGCSGSAAPASPAPNSGPDASAAIADPGPVANAKSHASIDCNKVFSPEDVADFMPGVATVSPYPNGDNACVFKWPDTSLIQVSGDGDMESALWTDPEVNQRDKYYTRLSGIGDEAFLKTSGGGVQVYVKKGSRYCGIVAAIDQHQLTQEALVRRLGALCGKYFAAH
ncbi:MAG: hypothetical protein ABI128_08160 [Rhodanobacter sp.]